MKTVRAIILLVAFCFVLPMAAKAGEGESKAGVPHSLEGISDVTLRNAIRDHSPNYDELGRRSQIFTYVDVYKWLNNGRAPSLAIEDETQLEAIAGNPAVVHSLDVPAVRADTYDEAGLNSTLSAPDWFDNPRLDSDTAVR